MLVVLAGVTVRPEKAWEKAVRASQGTVLHQGTCMLLRSPYFATLVLCFRPDYNLYLYGVDGFRQYDRICLLQSP